MPLRVYDETIRVLKSAVHGAKLVHAEELAAIKRLDDQARRLERGERGAAFDALMAEERRMSHAYGGRSVFGWEPAPREDDAAGAAGEPHSS